MKLCRHLVRVTSAAIGILALLLAEAKNVDFGGQSNTFPPTTPRPATTDSFNYYTRPTPNPAIASTASKRRVLVVTGMVETFAFFSGCQLLSEVVIGLDANKSVSPTFTRLLGHTFCVDKDKPLGPKGRGLIESVGGTVREVKLIPGHPYGGVTDA